jgi:hypothetical protein
MRRGFKRGRSLDKVLSPDGRQSLAQYVAAYGSGEELPSDKIEDMRKRPSPVGEGD